VAILFCYAQIIKRSEGRSAVAAAAYRCGMELEDERTGQTHDYTRKQGVIAQGILAPEGAPDWVRDPQQLWNRVEAKEDRWDSQLSRELVIAIPHEVEGEHREYLIKNCLRPVVRDGAIANYTIHEPSREGDERNYHAHVMLTMRRLTPDGESFGNKAREWNDKQALHEWKKTIERESNRMLERLGYDERVSVELEEGHRPTRHMGHRATNLERKGIKTERGEENREIQAENARRKQQKEREREQAELEREIEQLEADERRRKAEEARKSAEEEAKRQAAEEEAARAFAEMLEEIKEEEQARKAAQEEAKKAQEFERLRQQWEASSQKPETAAEEWNKLRVPSRIERPASIEATQTPTAELWKADRLHRGQPPPTPSPSNENSPQTPPQAPQRPAEPNPRSQAARAFEHAQQGERTSQPEPPRRRTEQREAFNKAARPPEEAEKTQETRRQGDGGNDSQTQTHAPEIVNKRRPRAQTAEEMRERQKNRSGRERTREPDRD
jgi:hypothetical protein